MLFAAFGIKVAIQSSVLYGETVGQLNQVALCMFSGILNLNPLAPLQPLVNFMLNDSSQTVRLQFECKMLCGKKNQSQIQVYHLLQSK